MTFRSTKYNRFEGYSGVQHTDDAPTDVIPHSSYYIIGNWYNGPQAHVFNNKGELLKTFRLHGIERFSTKIDRIERVMACVKARPVEITIICGTGTSIYFSDKNQYIITKIEKYHSNTIRTLDDVVKHKLCEDKIDLNWIAKNRTKILFTVHYDIKSKL